MTTTTQFNTMARSRSVTGIVGLALGASIATVAFTLAPGVLKQRAVTELQQPAVTISYPSLGTADFDDAPNVLPWEPDHSVAIPAAALPVLREFEDDAPNVLGWEPDHGVVAPATMLPALGEFEDAAPNRVGYEPNLGVAASAVLPSLGEFEDTAPNVAGWEPFHGVTEPRAYETSSSAPRRYGATASEVRLIGEAWVGPDAQVSGATYEIRTSADGLRQYRSPRYNPYTGFVQADLLSRDEVGDEWVGSTHIQITGIYVDGE